MRISIVIGYVTSTAAAGGAAVQVSETGVPQDYLQDPTGKHIASVSSAVQVGSQSFSS